MGIAFAIKRQPRQKKEEKTSPLPSWKKVCESPAVASWVNIYTEMALMMREVNSPECLRQGRQVFFVLPHLACVYLSSGVKCFFVVQFLFKLELDVFVCERSSGCKVQFLTLLHLPGSPSQEGPQPTGYQSPSCQGPGQYLNQWLNSGFFAWTGVESSLRLQA